MNNIIKLKIHNYHNKAVKYIKFNIQKIICNNIFKIIKINLLINLKYFKLLIFINN